MKSKGALLGNVEECMVNGRLPSIPVNGFIADMAGTNGHHVRIPVGVNFFTDQISKTSAPYQAVATLSEPYLIQSPVGLVQFALFNPLGKLVKIFLVPYNLADMPPNSQTFVRQRTLHLPKGATDKDSTKYLRYLIHLRFMSTETGKIYLHKDIRAVVIYKSDLDAAAMEEELEVRSINIDPKFYSPLCSN